KVYDAMKSVYGRVLISLERDADPYVLGRQKVYDRGGSLRGTVWVTNDFSNALDDAQVSWEIASIEAGEVVTKNERTVSVPADAAGEVDRVDWQIPSTAKPGAYRVAMQVLDRDGRELSSNSTDVTVH
ncbi:MAG: hypothetical protein ACRDG2_11365, partial [Actinomycetota bacterium]